MKHRSSSHPHKLRQWLFFSPSYLIKPHLTNEGTTSLSIKSLCSPIIVSVYLSLSLLVNLDRPARKMREMDEIRSTYVSPYGPSGDRSFDNEGYAWESKKNSSRKSSSIYSFSQSELKRQRRVAKYKSYVVEAKFKSALKNGVRWFKIKYSALVYA